MADRGGKLLNLVLKKEVAKTGEVFLMMQKMDFLADIPFSESGDKNLSGFRNLKGLFGR